MPGKGIPLEFSRTYAAQATPQKLASLGPLGAKWSHNWQSSLTEFNSANNVLARTPGGGVFVFGKSGSTYTAPAGVEAVLVKNGGGDWTLTTNAQTVYAFDSSGKLSSVKDRNGNTTSLTYDGSSRLTTITDAGGRSLTLAYNADSRISSVTDPLSRQVLFNYTNGDLTSVTDVKGGTTSYTYTGHLLTKITDSNNHDAVRNTYDARARVVTQLDALSNSTTFAYSTPGDGATRMTDARGHNTTYYFDQSMRVTDVMDALSNVTSFAYDSDNNRTCVTDPLGHKTGYAYDTAGNVTAMIDANNTNTSCGLATGGVQTTISYTAKNDPDTATDPRGNVSHYVYDANGNLTEVQHKDSGGSIKRRTCFTVPLTGANTGLVTERIASTTLTDCTGNKTKYEYDAYGNRTAVIDPRFASLGTPKTTMTYDTGGRRLTVTNELSHTTTFTYDNQNNVLTVKDNLNHTTTNTYDAKGNLKTATDANSKLTTYSYDSADRLTSVVDPDSKTTVYGYDANGNRTSVTNANRQTVGTPETGSGQCGSAGTGNGVNDDPANDSVIDDGCPSVIYAYDNVDRLTSETDALAHVWSYTYDAASRLYLRTDPKSQLTTYAYPSTRLRTGFTATTSPRSPIPARS